MKKLGILFVLFFISLSYAQSDELKLKKEENPYSGKVVLIKQNVVQFRMDSTEFVFEFNKQDIEYIKASNGKIVKFDVNSDVKPVQDTIKNGPVKNNYNQVEDKDLDSFASEKIGLTVHFIYQLSGTHEVSMPGASGSLDVNSAVAIGCEYDAVTILHFLKIGGGFNYQLPRAQVKVDGSFHFIPVYAFAKFGGFKPKRTNIYFTPEFGYNFFLGDEKYAGPLDLIGDTFFGLGVGLIVNNRMDIRAMYNRFNGSAELSGYSGKIKVAYTCFSLYAGYYF
jgi:hypothetical protein